MRQTWEREGCHRPNALCVAGVSQSTKLNLNLWGPFSGNRMNWRSLQRGLGFTPMPTEDPQNIHLEGVGLSHREGES